jgi:hypothetical protein
MQNKKRAALGDISNDERLHGQKQTKRLANADHNIPANIVTGHSLGEVDGRYEESHATFDTHEMTMAASCTTVFMEDALKQVIRCITNAQLEIYFNFSRRLCSLRCMLTQAQMVLMRGL